MGIPSRGSLRELEFASQSPQREGLLPQVLPQRELTGGRPLLSQREFMLLFPQREPLLRGLQLLQPESMLWRLLPAGVLHGAEQFPRGWFI